MKFVVAAALAAGVLMPVTFETTGVPPGGRPTKNFYSGSDPIQEESPGGTGLRGKIFYSGSDPDRRLPLEAQPACAALYDEPVLSERIVRDASGGLGNVLVELDRPGGNRPPALPAAPVRLVQEGCVYRPRIVVLHPGQELIVRNEDPFLHNVHCRPSLNPRFNIGQPFQGVESRRTFEAVERGIPIRCDVHPWMIAIVHVLDHGDYRVTAAGGGFEWSGLGPGRYRLRLWHEELGALEETVDVEAGRMTEVDLRY